MTGLIRTVDAKEPWAEYQLEDGTLLRFRFTACSFRLTGAKTAQGDPEYSFSSNVQIETHAPPAKLLGFKVVGFDGVSSAYSAPAEDCG